MCIKAINLLLHYYALYYCNDILRVERTTMPPIKGIYMIYITIHIGKKCDIIFNVSHVYQIFLDNLINMRLIITLKIFLDK